MENVSRLCELQAHLVGYPAIQIHDAISAKRVLLALESQVLLQDLRTMEGASEKMISGHLLVEMLHSNIISVISCGRLTNHSGICLDLFIGGPGINTRHVDAA